MNKDSYRVAMLSVHTCPLAVLGGKEAGGMNVYVRELSRELGRRGIMVDVFTRTQSLITPLTHTLSDNARIIHLPAGPLKPYNKNKIYDHLPEFVRNIQNFQRSEGLQYDVIHSHYWLSGYAGLVLSEKWRVPVVQMFHTLALLKNATARNESELEPDIRTERETLLMDKVDRIVAATAAEKASLSWQYGAEADKIDIIPCGVDLKLFKPRHKADARTQLGLTARNILLLVGRIEPIKGVDVLIGAIRQLVEKGERDTQVIVVGGGNKAGQDDNPEAIRLQTMVRELGLDDYVKFLPSQPQNLMPFYYSAADITIMSSYYESFGMAALESQACGTPVIASRAGGLPYTVKDGYSGLLVPPGDEAELANAIRQLLDDTQYRNKLGHQAILHAEQFSWRAIADRVLETYQDLTGVIAESRVSIMSK
ncbi:MAG: glycosyltransferase [Chloroflexi bacterium]|uniref:Glycosyltransferase n=1 Tax=Candidatus Chlorohelix allophototropha TaxID=3003348 RepID=A0A8T7M817_9CHLR|nr:glycosyltransferase [Chloroflexota bacterium]WJW68140.1 glycosyltransferase [Chloroflexota bacterium L227-S17]